MLATFRALPLRAQAEDQAADLAKPADGAGDADAAFDPSAFDNLTHEIGYDGACEVRSVFWAETTARLELFGALDLAQQRARIEREAHSLKSAAGTFGYRRLASLALRLEETASALEPGEYQNLLQQMDAAYAAALTCE